MKFPIRPCLTWLPIACLAFGLPANAQSTMAANFERDGKVGLSNLDADSDGIANSIDRDIDGDQLDNSDISETDIDGDGVPNHEDADMDADGIDNMIDEDFDCDGIDDPIDFTNDGGGGSFIDDESADHVTAFVSGMLRDLLGLDGCRELNVAVISISEPNGTWNFKTSDGISINGVWSYPANRPEEFKPFMGEQEAECWIAAQHPEGPVTFYTWLPGEPAGFAFATRSEESTGKMAPVYDLHSYVSGFPNAYPEILPQVISGWTSIMFSGDLRVFDGIGPIVDQQRAIFKIVTDWEKENYPAERR